MYVSARLVVCLGALLQATRAADSFAPASLAFGRPLDASSWSQSTPLAGRIEPAVAGEVAMVVLTINPNMVLYRDDVLSVVLPGFTACNIMSMRAETCDLESIASISGGTKPVTRENVFSARWSGFEQTIELRVLPETVQPGEIRVELQGQVTMPSTGLTASGGTSYSMDFVSQARPLTYSAAQSTTAARAPIGSTQFDTVQQVGSFSGVAVSFDTMSVPGDAVGLTFDFTPSFNLSAGEHVFFHLPRFGGAPVPSFILSGADAGKFNASWGAHTGRIISAVPPDAGYAPDLPSTHPRLAGALEATTLTLTATGPISAGTALSVIVPVSAGLKLPYSGLCTVRDVASCMIEADAAAGPVNPISISKYNGQVGTSHLCAGDPPFLRAPKLVHLGHEILVEWMRPAAGVGADPEDRNQQSHRHDWIGLFKKDACQQPEYSWGAAQDANTRASLYQSQGGIAQFANKCYLASRSVSVDGAHVGQSSGHVSFHFEDYQAAGEYEARYFRGDSPAGNGIVCRGLPSLIYTSHGGTAVQCTLEAAAESEPISVEGTPNKGQCAGIPNSPDVYRC